MNCIVKKLGILLLTAAIAVGSMGCGEEIVLEQKYDAIKTTEKYGMSRTEAAEQTVFFADKLCVGGNEDILDEAVTPELSKAAGLFDLQDHDIVYAQSIHERLYPASTTKILTAYLALKYGNLQDVATVSEQAVVLEAGSTTCGLSAGDQITLEQLLYGLIMCSGNDAANVIAEMISGSVEEFANLMNREAQALGATNSHFMNPHGLHDEQHYTTVYDMYLIFSAAIQDETFRQIINTTAHTAQFTNSQGETVEKQWDTTNRYLKGESEVPDGVTVVGGKTGTTNDAGYCLVLYSENENGVPYISIVMKAESRDDLYYKMTELLKKISNL